MKPLKLYSFLNNNKLNNVISSNFETAVEENKKAITVNTNNVIVLAGITDFNKLVDRVDSFFGQWRETKILPAADAAAPRPAAVRPDIQPWPGIEREKNKQETLNFLKVIRDKYGKKSMSAIIKELEYGEK